MTVMRLDGVKTASQVTVRDAFQLLCVMNAKKFRVG